MFRYLAILALGCFVALFGCGGGGGGGPTADVAGRIMLLSTGQPLTMATVTISGHSIVTDSTGTFTLRGVPATALTMVVTATGIKMLTQNLPSLTPSTLTDLGDVFVLDTASGASYDATASGTIVRSDTGAPVSGAIVKLSGQITLSSSSGSFAFVGLPAGLGGNVQVGVVKATGFDDKAIFIDPPLGKSPPDNPLGPIQISPPVGGGIPPGPSNIRGVISLQGATDLSGTIVTLVDKTSGSTVGTQPTDKAGNYGFYVVAGTYTVKASHPAFKDQSKDITLARPDQPQTVNMTLIP